MTRRAQLTSTIIAFYQRPVAQVSLELVFSVIAIIVLTAAAIRPTLTTMSNLIHEIEEKKALSQALSQKIAALSTVQSEYQQAEPKLFVLDEALPTKPDIKYVVQAIEKLANDNDISLLSLSSSEYPLDKDVTFSPELKRTNKVFSFTVSGEFANIRQFIEQIQQLRRVLVIDSITFSLTELSGSKVLQANIVVNMQYFDKSEAVKAK